MITIKITDRSIRMNGHACQKSPDGIDRVCAAVSALTCNLINSLKDLTGDRIRGETASGMPADQEIRVHTALRRQKRLPMREQTEPKKRHFVLIFSSRE